MDITFHANKRPLKNLGAGVNCNKLHVVISLCDKSTAPNSDLIIRGVSAFHDHTFGPGAEERDFGRDRPVQLDEIRRQVVLSDQLSG